MNTTTILAALVAAAAAAAAAAMVESRSREKSRFLPRSAKRLDCFSPSWSSSSSSSDAAFLSVSRVPHGRLLAAKTSSSSSPCNHHVLPSLLLPPQGQEQEGQRQPPWTCRERLVGGGATALFATEEKTKMVEEDKDDRDDTSSSSSSIPPPPPPPPNPEVEEWLQRARELRREASQEEAILREAQQRQQSKTMAELDAVIDKGIFSLPRENENENENENDEEAIVAALADWMQQENLKTSKALRLMERLHQRQEAAWRASQQESLRQRASLTPSSNISFQIAGPSSVSDEDYKQLKAWLERMVSAAQLLVQRSATLDSNNEKQQEKFKDMATALQKRLQELQRANQVALQRRLEVEERNAVPRQGGGGRVQEEEGGGRSTGLRDIDNFVQDTMGKVEQEDGNNNTNKKNKTKKSVDTSRLLEEMENIPMWIPVSLLPYVLLCQDSLDPNDVQTIQTEVLMGSDFYCTTTSSIRKAALYRGTIRRRQPPKDEVQEEDAATIWKDIQQRLEQQEDGALANRVQLFFLSDPEQEQERRRRQREGGDDASPIRPIIVALPKSVVPEQAQERGWGIKVLTGVSTLSALVTCFMYSVSAFALNPTFVETLQSRDAEAMGSLLNQNCLPLLGGLVGLQVIHEVAHALAARQAQVQLGWPVPLPSLRLGTFGSITPLRSFPSSRTALFDVALSGPAATMLVSLGMILLSLWWSVPTTTGEVAASAAAAAAAAATDSNHLSILVPAGLLKSSSLICFGATLLFPQWLSLSVTESISLHPLFFVGLSGLVPSALNLLPIGRLDGGRLATAVFGRRMAYLLSFLSLVGLAIAALSGVSAVSIFWGLVVTVFQRQAEIPLQDEWTPLSPAREGVYAVFVVLTLLTLIPVPGGLGAF